jgi:3-hydroxyacyl-CoA dehydrogenase
MPVVKLTVEDALATLTVDNPPLNLFSDKVQLGLEEQLNALSEDTSVRALLIRTEGPHFMAGADVHIFEG